MKIRVAEKGDMAAVFALRIEVFVEEQKVPREIELDAEDAHAVHFIAEQTREAVGCARVIIEGESAHIGRLAVKKAFRGQGVGTAVCRFAMDYCLAQGCTYIWLNSQRHAMGFYQKLGFCPHGESFMEAGIKHIRMVKEIKGE